MIPAVSFINTKVLWILMIVAGLVIPGASLLAAPVGPTSTGGNPDAAAGSFLEKTSPDQPSLDQLREIHLPAEVSFWPLAPGWWLALALLLVLGSGLCWWLGRYWRSNRYRKQARRLLQDHYKRCAGDQHKATCLRGVNEILRRTALMAFPRQRVAALAGDDWVAFLARSSDLDAFQGGEGQILALGPYAPDPQFDADKLQALALRWVRRHSRRRLKRSPARKGDSRAQTAVVVKNAPPGIIGAERPEPKPLKEANGARASSGGSAC